MTLLTLAMPSFLLSKRWPARPPLLLGGDPLAGFPARGRVRIAIRDRAVLDEGLAPAAQPLEGRPLLVARVGDLVGVGVAAEQLVPGRERLGVLLLRVEAFTDPVLRVVGQVGVRVGAQVL